MRFTYIIRNIKITFNDLNWSFNFKKPTDAYILFKYLFVGTWYILRIATALSFLNVLVIT